MSMARVRQTRGVPAKRGMRVRYGGSDQPQEGVIKSARGGYLKIMLDGESNCGTYHPTWKLDYLDDDGNVILKSPIS